MTRLVSIAVLLALAPHARADVEPDGPKGPCYNMRKIYNSGDFEGALKIALQCYELDPRPQILFAIAQIHFNLHHYKEAIDYYEKFKATNPPADQAALAEQGIGAARAELDRPPPAPPPPPPPPAPKPEPHHDFDGFDRALVITGGIALAGTAVLFYRSHALADDRSGSLATYSHRIDRAYLARNVAYGTAAGGVIALGAALLRWRFHLVDTVTVEASPGGAAASWVHAW